MNKAEILAKHLAKHNALGTQKDAEDKEEFDREHREIWRECDVELKQRLTELEAEANPNGEALIEIQELKAYLGI